MTWVVSCYGFRPLRDIEALRERIATACREQALKGTVLLAPEGFNVALAGRRDALLSVVATFFSDADAKWSRTTAERVFRRLKVRVKEEIVTFGRTLGSNDPVGKRVDAPTWDKLLADPQVLTLDARNAYESASGRFRGAICANTASFREFPAFVARQLDPSRHQHIALYCTGGIRCEKASAHLLERGFPHVYQLDGGILRYLAQASSATNTFEGKCFVFDERKAVTAQDVDESNRIEGS